uniref:Uncharacterized protein n=1 Tax=Sphaerodactylus townsendi TaxID=933632 RepID=A0ACB8FF78_9SAUR
MSNLGNIQQDLEYMVKHSKEHIKNKKHVLQFSRIVMCAVEAEQPPRREKVEEKVEEVCPGAELIIEEKLQAEVITEEQLQAEAVATSP